MTCMVLGWSMGLGGAAGVTVQPAMSFRQVQVTAAHDAGALATSAEQNDIAELNGNSATPEKISP